MITLEELRPLQLAIIDVYNSFKNICQENGLKYYMIGGCLIGAFRNSGFIPWDDDMDIAMPREDYNRLIDILRKSDNVSYIANHYLMDTYTSGSYLLKLCNPSVKYGKFNSDGTVENFDASLSVFPLNGTPKTKIGRMIYEQRVKIRYTYLRFVRASHNGIYAKKHSLIERIGIMINNVMHIGKKTSIREAAQKLDDILQKYDYNSSNSVSFYTYGMSPFFLGQIHLFDTGNC